MKKLCFFMLAISIFCLSAISAQSDDRFINALKTCSASYHESDTVNANGVTAFSTKSMSGWKNNVCTYKETLTINEMNITTTCNFTKPQIEEITKVADAYYLTLKYGQEQPEATSIESAKNNPIFNVLNKYLQDPSVCMMSGI